MRLSVQLYTSEFLQSFWTFVRLLPSVAICVVILPLFRRTRKSYVPTVRPESVWRSNSPPSLFSPARGAKQTSLRGSQTAQAGLDTAAACVAHFNVSAFAKVLAILGSNFHI